MDQTEISIAYIGGGSCQWAIHLMSDLALSARLTGHLRLYDIDYDAAKENMEFAKSIFSHIDSKCKFKVTAEKNVRSALKGVDFVIMSIEPGPTEARYGDLEIPRKYGIEQPVGDTIGPGGLLRAMRCVPVYIAYAKLIMELCPKAWVINYTNPMTVCTAVLYAVTPEIKAFGCCYEIFGVQGYLAELVKKWFHLKNEPRREEIKLDIAGVNHFTHAASAKWQGQDLFPHIQDMISEKSWFSDKTQSSLKRKKEKLYTSSEKIVMTDFF